LGEKCELRVAVVAAAFFGGVVWNTLQRAGQDPDPETNKTDSPTFDLRRESLVSFSAPLAKAASVSRRGDLFSPAELSDIFSPDPQRTDSEASGTNLRPVTLQIANAIASDETLPSDLCGISPMRSLEHLLLAISVCTRPES
jgi:hypothetical protein